MRCILLLIFVAFCDLSVCEEEWVQTPHGLRPKECVIGHFEEEVELTPQNDGLVAYYPLSNTTKFYKSSLKCRQNAAEIAESWRQRLNGTDSNVQNGGWEIYAHFGANNLGRFDSTYYVPNQNLPVSGQLLYYFIGLTNFDSSETIIQPVVAWCGTNGGCGFSYEWSGWQMAAWNCCPSGLSNYGKGVQLQAGEKITTYVTSNPTAGNIQVYMSASGGVSSLNENGDSRQFNDAEICGEFYSYSNCNQFNSEPMLFYDDAIKDLSGNAVNGKWQIENNNPLNCGGNITFYSASNTGIYAGR